MLIARAARGMGVSPYALTADFGNSGYLTARFAVEADERFYRRVQHLLSRWCESAIDFWAYTNAVMDPDFLSRWQGYQLRTPAFPFVDPVKEAAANKIEIELGTDTPQNVIRRKNLKVTPGPAGNEGMGQVQAGARGDGHAKQRAKQRAK